VGKFAAAAFLDPERFRGQVLELSHEPLTYEEVAQRLSAASGVQVRVRYRTEEETAAVVAAGTLPVIAIQVWAKEVSVEHDPSALQKYGIPLGSLSEYLEREKSRLHETLGV